MVTMAGMDIRRAVRDEMERRGLTTYALWKMLDGKVNKQTVYNFVDHGADIRSGHLGFVLDALEISLTPPAKKPRK